MTDLISELRDACKSGKGNYGHRLLCGKAADEIEQLRRDQPVFDDLTKSLSAGVDKIQHLKNMLMLAYQLLMDQRRPTLEQEQMIRDAFAEASPRCSCGAHQWGPNYHRIIDSNLNSHYSDRCCDTPEPPAGGLDCGVDLRTGKGVCVCGRCSP